MFKIYFNENGISVRREKKPVLVIDKNGIYVSDGLPPDEAIEWITVNGTHIPLNGKGEQVGGPDIGGKGGDRGERASRGSGTSHLVALKSGEKLPESVEKALGRKIPPSYTNIRYSTDPKAELQAIATDKAGRTQRLYSKEHFERAKEAKFSRNAGHNRAEIDNAIKEAIKKDPETGDCLRLIRETGLRPGSLKDTKAKEQAYGASTLLGKHVVVEGNKVILRFTGKDNVKQEHVIENKSTARNLIERKKRAGDDGRIFNTNGRKLLKALPKGTLVKDLRTIKATDTAKKLLKDIPPATSRREMVRVRNEVGEKVCKILGNKRDESLRSYIDPQVFKDHSPKGMAEFEKKKGE